MRAQTAFFVTSRTCGGGRALHQRRSGHPLSRHGFGLPGRFVVALSPCPPLWVVAECSCVPLAPAPVVQPFFRSGCGPVVSWPSPHRRLDREEVDWLRTDCLPHSDFQTCPQISMKRSQPLQGRPLGTHLKGGGEAQPPGPRRPSERNDPTQHAEGTMGDCPGPRKETATRRNVTQGAQPPPSSD